MQIVDPSHLLRIGLDVEQVEVLISWWGT